MFKTLKIYKKLEKLLEMKTTVMMMTVQWTWN